MSNGYFKFKQFTVWHDRCAMKVGTDGVLLGAWTSVDKSKRILDVGTGSGLVALMLAQRCGADITAVEIDEAAVEQAKMNVEQSPWKDRISVVNMDFKEFYPDECFDAIVSNPPYFVDSLLPTDKQRTSARHTTELDYSNLISHAAELLTPDGELTLIIPYAALKDVEETGWRCGLHPVRRLSVVTRYGAQPKRAIVSMSFCRDTACLDETLYMEDENREYSDEYVALIREFYLNV